MIPRVGTCLHCQRQLSLIGRGLCGRCYTRPEVRAVYPCRTRKPKLKPAAAALPDPDGPVTTVPGRELTELERLRVSWFGSLAA